MSALVELRASAPPLKCPYCHDELSRSVDVGCGRCATRHHLDCFVANGGCAVMGCRSGVPRPRVTLNQEAFKRRPERRFGAVVFTVLFALPLLIAACAAGIATGRSMRDVEIPVAASPAGCIRKVAMPTEVAPPAEAAPVAPSIPAQTPSPDSEMRDNEYYAIEQIVRYLWSPVHDPASFPSEWHGYRFTFEKCGGGELHARASPTQPGVTGDYDFFAACGGITWTRWGGYAGSGSCIPTGK
jgi:hypothetical protein